MDPLLPDSNRPQTSKLKRRPDIELIQENAPALAKRFRPRSQEISTVKASIDKFRDTFPLHRFNYAFPSIVFQHQLYSALSTRSMAEVDREVNILKQNREIRCFNLNPRGGDEVAIVKTVDYREHIRAYARDHVKSSCVIEKFFDMINNFDMTITTVELMKDGMFSEDDIRILAKVGVLIMRDCETWWLSFPGAIHFMKLFLNGREKVMLMVKKAKNASVLESELIHRGLPKNQCIGMHYAIHDVIGRDLVETVTTTKSGRLLRYNK